MQLFVIFGLLSGSFFVGSGDIFCIIVPKLRNRPGFWLFFAVLGSRCYYCKYLEIYMVSKTRLLPISLFAGNCQDLREAGQEQSGVYTLQVKKFYKVFNVSYIFHTCTVSKLKQSSFYTLLCIFEKNVSVPDWRQTQSSLLWHGGWPWRLDRVSEEATILRPWLVQQKLDWLQGGLWRLE